MFTRIDHVAFLVEDMDAGRTEFEEIYGIECTGTNADGHRRSTGAEAAFFDVGEVVVELLSPMADAENEGWPHQYMAEHGEGFFHVAYAVDDLADATATVTDRGISLLHEEPMDGFSGQLITLDPDDTLVPTQLVEPDGRY